MDMRGLAHTPHRVLVVEDDRSVARMLKFSLTAAGFDVIHVTTGREAIGILNSRPPDAVVLDLGLGDGLGGAVLERLRKEPDDGNGAPFGLVMSPLDYQEVTQLYGSLKGRPVRPLPADGAR